jgi:hypothetical protein
LSIFTSSAWTNSLPQAAFYLEQLIAGEVVVGKAVLGDHINATDRP